MDIPLISPPSNLDLLDLRLFGSQARKDSDCLSDIDVLAVIDEENNSIDIEKVHIDLVSELPGDWELMTIRSNDLRVAFREGTPFAWHLYLESKSLMRSGSEFLISLGAPSKYTFFQQDVLGFQKILCGVVEALRFESTQPTYEAGHASICLRNIGICLSLAHGKIPVFGRFALEQACTAIGIKNPLTHQELEFLNFARRVSQSAVSIDSANYLASSYFSLCKRSLDWVNDLPAILKGYSDVNSNEL